MRLSYLLCLRKMKSVLILQETIGHQGTIIKGLYDVEDLSPWVSGWGPQIFNRPDTPTLFSLEALPSIILPHQDIFCSPRGNDVESTCSSSVDTKNIKMLFQEMV